MSEPFFRIVEELVNVSRDRLVIIHCHLGRVLEIGLDLSQVLGDIMHGVQLLDFPYVEVAATNSPCKHLESVQI